MSIIGRVANWLVPDNPDNEIDKDILGWDLEKSISEKIIVLTEDGRQALPFSLSLLDALSVGYIELTDTGRDRVRRRRKELNRVRSRP
jgi:hypothetical protein